MPLTITTGIRKASSFIVDCPYSLYSADPHGPNKYRISGARATSWARVESAERQIVSTSTAGHIATAARQVAPVCGIQQMLGCALLLWASLTRNDSWRIDRAHHGAVIIA
jgi:hypothetical protein